MRISDWSSDVCSSDLGCKDVAGDEQRHREDKEEGRGDEIDDGFRSLREALVDHIDPDVRILAQAISARQLVLHAEHEEHALVKPDGRRDDDVSRDHLTVVCRERKRTSMNSRHYCAARMTSSD